MKRSTLRRGFTLIELLVVISIISLLAAILFPVFARARENARRAGCQSKLKQIGLAVMQYTQDYDDHMPLGEIYTFSGQSCAPWLLDGPLFHPYNSDQPTWMGYIYPYTKSTQLYYCPSGPNNGEALEWKNASTLNRRFGYAYNPYVLVQGLWNPTTFDSTTCTPNPGQPRATPTGMHVARFSEPASVAMLCDRAAVDRGAMAAPSTTTPVRVETNGRDTASTYGFNPSLRHFEGSNFLYVDGHVKWLSNDGYFAAKPGIFNSGIS
jgi:prepilin-type N-terminal cleavage/methylation domain-containing protein/prepilin-type processing-associated H-X9-DG protein